MSRPEAAEPDAPAGDDAARRVLAAARDAGRSFARVVWTDNRRVMLSIGDCGATLRLHRAFRTAPPEVLRAVGRFCAARSAADRRGAQAVLAAFLREHRPSAPASRPRRRRVAPADRPHLERLLAEFRRVNREHFQDALPEVPLFLSGRMTTRNGHFSMEPLEIVISRRLCADAEPGEAERTLRHEMIHLWQHQQGSRPDHGAEFRRWARRLGVRPRARRTVRWRAAG